MKILIIVPYLYDGGAERVASRWANILSSNYEVYCLTFYPLEKEYYLVDSVVRMNLYKEKKEYSRKKIWKNIKNIKKIINDVNPSYIIPFLTETNILTFLANNTNATLLLTIRNSPWHDPSNFFERKIRDFFVKRNKKVIVQNYEQSNYFKSKRINKYIVCNPVNDEILSNVKTQYNKINKIIAIGRLAPQKNFKMMINAISFLKKNGKDVYLDIYGDGELRDELNTLIRINKLEKNINLKGNYTNVLSIEKDYDLFLMTSLYEGFPNALLEAMSIGLPVISVNCKTGPKDLINDGENGFLLDSYNYVDLAKKIIQIDDVFLLKKIGQNARAYVTKEYSSENCKNQLLNILK